MIFVSVYVSALGTHRHIPDLKQPPRRTATNGFSLRRAGHTANLERLATARAARADSP